MSWLWLTRALRTVRAYALNGKIMTEVTHSTTPVKMCISGNHHEEISFLLIRSPHATLVLGHPWLQLHNAQFDWSRGKILGWSAHCHSLCLRSAFPPSGGDLRVAASPPDPPDLSSVPAEYL